MRYSGLVLCALLFIISCNSNQASEEDINQILEQLEDVDWGEDVDYEDYDEIVYDVEIVTAPNKVEELALEVDDLIEAKRIDDRWEMSLGNRYVNGDEDAVDEIVETLEGIESDEKDGLFWQLDPYEKPDFELKNPKIVRAVIGNLYDWTYESRAIELMANQKVPNYLSLFEKRLLSGKSLYQGDLILYLGDQGTSMKALNYFEEALWNNEMEGEQLSNAIGGLRKFRTNGNQDIQQKVDELCFYIYSSGEIPAEDYESLGEDYEYGNPAYELLNMLFDFGGEEMRGAGIKFSDVEILEDVIFAYFVRLDGEKHRREIIERMKYKDTYSNGVEMAVVLFNKNGDARILQSAVTNFEYLYDEDDYSAYYLDQLVIELISAVDDSAKIMLENNLKSKLIREHALDLFETQKLTFADYESFYLEIGLIEEPLSPKRIERAIADGWGNDLYTSLDASNIHFWFDSEEIDGTAEYDYLTDFLKQSSLGKLDDMTLALDKSYDDEYEYLVVLNGVGYKMEVGERDEWDYRIIGDLIYLTNFILEDIGSERTFHLFNYDEYLYATEKQVAQMQEKFRIADSD